MKKLFALLLAAAMLLAALTGDDELTRSILG